VLLGCAYAGVVNTLDHITDISGGKSIRAVIGGMHLLHASDRRLEKTMDALDTHAIDVIAPGHCTGQTACALVKARFKPEYRPCFAGACFEFE